ncbi:MAG: sulfotransferase family protein, partial [Planctomycetia bacterium]
MPLGVWLPLANEHRWRVSPSRWGLVATITGSAVFNSAATGICEAVHGRRLRSPPETPPPLFIIGHWRSGTTLLHELFMLDRRFCCPNYYQCYAPSHFLLTERVLTPALSWIIPAKRPMDDMTASLDKPQEDEFALMNLGAPSPYRRMAFPVTSSPHPEALDLTTLTPSELDRWRRTLRRFLGMLAVADPRRPVLKSPPHTARVGVLAEMFPEARFLHIVRDPFAVFGSTMRLWKSLDEGQGLQVTRGEHLEGYVFE